MRPRGLHGGRLPYRQGRGPAEHLAADWCIALDLVKRFLRQYGRIDVEAGDDERLASKTVHQSSNGWSDAFRFWGRRRQDM
jgi:hypothetical protein